MDNNYDYIINSDQEDLVGSSSSGIEDDDDFEYSEEVQFTRENENSTDRLALDDSATIGNAISHEDCRPEEFQEQSKQWEHFRECNKTIKWLIFYGLALLASSLGLFVIIPVYQKQLEVGVRRGTAHGTIIFASIVITLILLLLTYFSNFLFKSKIKVLQLPNLPTKRFLVIALCCGVAGTLCTVSSYGRVSCHLQDPLKGAALVGSLTFYFFFCKRVMGLQKVFSATTGVVGLFICVDYGLCDEFRCHGISISNKSIISTPGWQGRAFWTLTYIVGIILWTLHISLLEGELVMMSSIYSSVSPNNLLKTISRLVSNSDREPIINDRPHQIKRMSSSATEKPHPIHLALWIHIISLPILLILGTIDVIPISGTKIKPFSEHWTETGNTVLCHLGINPNYEEHTFHQSIGELPSTVSPSIHRPDGNRTKRDVHHNHHPDHLHRKPDHHHVQLSKHSSHRDMHAFRKYKNITSNKTPSTSASLGSVTKTEGLHCGRVRFYVWSLILIYIGFIVCLFNFLIISESAVFTMAMVTGALPFLGLFWSLFKLEAHMGIVFLEWTPSITGELICSLLGTPIVFLGILLLYRAHFNDILRPPLTCSTPIAYTNLSEP